MATPSEKLAQSLDVLKSLQDRGIVAIRTGSMTRTHRERLLKSGFIQEVMKGWYIPTRPDEPSGESTAWYASFWSFVADYLSERFGQEWCLSPEQSIAIHVGNWTVPKQLLVRTPKGGNKPTKLLHNTSIFDLRLDISAKEIEENEGLRIMSLPTALIACTPAQYTNHPVEMRAALSSISDASDILRNLLSGNHSTIAGRLAGALRNIGREQLADTIVETMKSAGYTINENDPFEERSTIHFSTREVSPYVNRLKIMWETFRKPILKDFPTPPEPITDIDTYLQKLDEIFVTDAYHSLSIEGYRVSEELIEHVRGGNWNPDSTPVDREHHNALAARGYWQAFQAVKDSVRKVLDKENAGEIAKSDHGTWYRELFGPSVVAGIIEAADLAGYRNRPVYIRKSMHTPPNWESVRELTPTFFELLENEENAQVRVVLGHFIFVYIHPYVDGNGRMGRFLMNLMLASGGYNWLVIPVERRNEYMSALEAASVHQDIKPFTHYLAELVDTTT
ncbi:Fic family protein [Solemya elarraichensis gill symbiont]|uniref:Cell filamentation protein Fic n=1 Tax=Solemya elarraichensis gill symbiont TaxID=1918949 RepID=A0A1T2KZK4_9GAMM|nr:Fic family protein [Solemya elarraichensis gill symbiont]OOZ38278.1 cell filamentation protein Fic [Solemya elarraichensis gill symbiont]